MNSLKTHDPGGKIKILVDKAVKSKVLFSTDQRHRYFLIRKWGKSGKQLIFILMNPSVATVEHDDPTVAKCRRFAVAMGYNSLVILNVISYRLTKSGDLKKLKYNNNTNLKHIKRILDKPGEKQVICGWGNLPKHMQIYADDVVKLLQVTQTKAYCFGVNNNGSPKHPLYINKNTELVRYGVL